jgi:MOSC domain-containing protein YiiM
VPILESVNLGVVRAVTSKSGESGIDKRPAEHPVQVRAPGPRGQAGAGGSGLIGDPVVDTDNHGGDDQAVYAYAREDLDAWQAELGPLRAGMFGENLTTRGLDVTGARIGERWRIGASLLLQITCPRIPCRTFAAWLDRRGWVKTFTQRALPGAYLRVVEPGEIRAGDPIAVEHRPDHDVTVGLVFRAVTLEPELLPRLLVAPELPGELRELALRRTTFTLDPD